MDWLHTQVTHHVSLAATKAFWKLSFQHVAKLYELKADQGISRKIPQFPQVRKNIYKDYCPDVKMTFAFMNKNDGSIVYVNEDHTPLQQYQRDPQYQKLFEEAHVEVNYSFLC